jgi:hypothetical protein
MWLKEVHVIVLIPRGTQHLWLMVAKVSRIASWVPMRLFPWAQCKKWIPIESMGCVHTHWEMLPIEGWGSPSRIWSVVKKNGEDNQKVGETNWTVNQAPTLRPKHDKIWAQWVLDILLENMLEKVWCCKHSKMESWNWTICCPMSCSNGRRHARVGGGRDYMPPWGVARKEMCCCWLMLRLQEGRDVDQP